MQITTLDVPGPALVEAVRMTDERGSFARVFDSEEFLAAGLEPVVLHYQVEPATEAKLVRCVRGAVYDVAVDVRPGSPTYLQHVGVELHEDDDLALYVPPMFAHGYLTLRDRTEVTYQVSARYTPAAERGLRHDDPALGITWPADVLVVSDKDRAWPLLEDPAGAR